VQRSAARDYALAAALVAAGTGLAMLCVYVGTGLLDGFGDRDLSRLGSRLRRYAPIALAGALVAGVLLHGYHARLLARPAPAWTVLVSIPRAFAHFPAFGMLALLGFVLAFVWGPLLWIAALLRLRPRGVPVGEAPSLQALLVTGVGVPIWFLTFPFDAAGAAGESDFPKPSPVLLQGQMLWLLPWLLAAVALLSGAESGDTGERVAPGWLALAASYWIGDYLVVALQTAPALRARWMAERWRAVAGDA